MVKQHRKNLASGENEYSEPISRYNQVIFDYLKSAESRLAKQHFNISSNLTFDGINDLLTEVDRIRQSKQEKFINEDEISSRRIAKCKVHWKKRNLLACYKYLFLFCQNELKISKSVRSQKISKKKVIMTLSISADNFLQIARRKKKEEYRPLSKYWSVRFTNKGKVFGLYKKIDILRFRILAYKKPIPVMEVEYKGLDIGYSKPKWNYNKVEKCFIIKLGNIISMNNFKIHKRKPVTKKRKNEQRNRK